MTQETVITKKRRGPAPTGKGTFIGVRLQPGDLDALDQHIAAQPEPRPSRPEAIRRVLAEGLNRSAQGRGSQEGAKASHARSRASDAADVEMKSVDAPADEKARRRRSLTDEPAAVTKARRAGPRQ